MRSVFLYYTLINTMEWSLQRRSMHKNVSSRVGCFCTFFPFSLDVSRCKWPSPIWTLVWWMICICCGRMSVFQRWVRSCSDSSRTKRRLPKHMEEDSREWWINQRRTRWRQCHNSHMQDHRARWFEQRAMALWLAVTITGGAAAPLRTSKQLHTPLPTQIHFPILFVLSLSLTSLLPYCTPLLLALLSPPITLLLHNFLFFFPILFLFGLSQNIPHTFFISSLHSNFF